MALFDLPLEQLESYRSPDAEPKDFDQFWSETLADAATYPLNVRFEAVSDPVYKTVSVYDVSFAGYGGQTVRGWLLEPAGNPQRLPCLVKFIGYGGGRGYPAEHLLPAAAGFIHFVMDTRGQGSTWSPGETPDDTGSGPQHPGFMTRGISSPETYYYRRVFTDAVRAVEAAAAFEHVDPQRIGVTGGSQGGGISIAAAGLLQDRIKLLMPDVPFLCHYRRGITMVDTMPYAEIASYLKIHRGSKQQVLRTLSYFDGVNFASRVTARSLFSVGLMDTICPPSTIYAAYNAVTAPKEMAVYEFNNHEGGGGTHDIVKMRFAQTHL